MAVAEIIGSAVGVLLLVIVAYLLVGGTLSTAETVVAAQKDMTLLQELRLKTSIDLTDAVHQSTAGVSNFLNLTVTNSGNEVIPDYQHVDVYTYDAGNTASYYRYDDTNSGTPGTWFIIDYSRDAIHAHELDPGDVMRISVVLPTTEYTPDSVQMTTSNGVKALMTV